MYITDHIEKLMQEGDDNNFTEGALLLAGLFIASIITSVVGAVLLAFTALSPLVIGGILGAIIPAFFILSSLISLCNLRNRDSTIEYWQKDLLPILTWTVISGLMGVGIAALSSAMFSVIGIGTCTLIGATVPLLAFLTTFVVIIPLAKVVNEYIISPIIERFSSKKKEADPLDKTVKEYIISPIIERFSSNEKESDPSLPCNG